MEISCKCVGMLSGGKWDRVKEQNRRVYSTEYISPTLTTCGGGNQEVKIAEPIFIGGIGERNFGKQYRQGNRIYDSGGIAVTLTSQPVGSAGGQSSLYLVREPQALRMVRTEEGKRLRKQYEAHEIECGFNEHRIAEPREDGCSNTLSTVQKDNYIVKPVIGAIRGRNPENPSDRTAGIETQQRLEIGGDCSNALTTVQKDNVVIEPSIRVRKLTPRECFRLMGFSDDDFDKATSVNSNSQLYKQAGNSIVVNVLTAIFGQMIAGKEDVYKQGNP